MRGGRLMVLGTLAVLLAVPAGTAAWQATGTTGEWNAAQATVTQSDIQRLQDAVYDLSRDISRLRDRDARLASQLQDELDEIRDEVTYLRVRLRREQSVPRSEYTEVRNRIETLRSRAAGPSADRTPTGAGSATGGGVRTGGVDTTAPSTRRTTSGDSVIPVGTELDVRLIESLSSDRNQVEDRFTATTLVDLEEGGRVVVPAGSELRGVVSSVTPAGRLERTGRMSVSFDQITVNGRTYPMRGTVTQALESEGIRGEAAKIGTGAGVGAIIGGILGGLKGALAGILIGGGGVIAATEGKDVHLPAGTVLRVRLDSPPDIGRR